jgi:hypothetical protein
VLDENVPLVLERIGPDDVVLDIGGWGRPFNRADAVIDLMPYETRGSHGPGLPAQGGDRERFTAGTWIQRDVCAREPFPFADKSVGFAICSHVLEDVRDPLWVCQEMVRVARRGYLEVPSRLAESSRGVEHGIVGWSHHRWLIDIDGDAVTFLMKYHTIHARWRYSLPARLVRSLPPRRHVQWLFWEDRFTFRERTIHGVDRIADELEAFVGRTHAYPGWFRAAGRLWSRAESLAARVTGGVARHLRRGGTT